LETLREYALEQLRLHGELDAARRQHAQYFCQLAGIANPLLRGPDEILWLDRLEANHDNFRAALAWSLDSPPDLATGLQLVGMLWWLWYVRSYMREGLDWLQQALAKAPNDLPALRAKILQGASRFIVVNHLPDAKRLSRLWNEESISLYRQLDDPWNLAKSLGYVGNYAETPEEFAPAAADARAIFRRINDAWGYAWVAIMEHVIPQPSIQHLPLAESVSLMRSINAKTGLALALAAQTVQIFESHNYEQVLICAEESIALYQKTGDKWTRAGALLLFTDALIALNRREGLAEMYAEGILLAQQVGNSKLEAKYRQRQEWLKQQG